MMLLMKMPEKFGSEDFFDIVFEDQLREIQIYGDVRDYGILH